MRNQRNRTSLSFGLFKRPCSRHEEDQNLALNRLAFTALLSVALAVAVPRGVRATPSPRAQDHETLRQAEAASRGHNYARAVTLYTQVLSAEPDNSGALLGLGRAYLLSGQFKRAVATYKSLLHREPRHEGALVGLGEAYNLLGQYVKAESSLRRALQIAPDDANAAWALGRTYLYEGRIDHARVLLERATDRHPQDYRLWESLGEVQLKQGHRTAAGQSLHRALQLNPKAKRAQILLDKLEVGDASASGVKVGFHSYAYLLGDAAGNQILSVPETWSFVIGSRWRSRLTGDYRRAAFRPPSGLPPAAQGSEVAPADSASEGLTASILTIRNSTEFRVSDALSLTGGVGFANYFGEGGNKPVYDAGFTLAPTPRLSFSYHYGQDIVAPTELAARLGLTERGWSGHFHYRLPEELALGLGYYQGKYSDSNRLRGGNLQLERKFRVGPLQLRAGYNLESLSFSRSDLFHGYFSPKRYLANSGLVGVRGHKGRFDFDYDFDLGEESYTRAVKVRRTPLLFVYQRRSSPRFIGRFRNSFNLTPRWSLQASFLLYRSALSSGTGAYQAHAFLFGITRNF